ncbi:MAG: inorganic phosphate transporter [Deltaproteobacteria bacterium]|nr:inorganic phosphate transporter [Deltaproteobacteria bacterium]
MADPFFTISVGLTLGYAFVTGFSDGGNVVAATICSRAMNPWRALVWASIAEFVGPVSLGTAVAKTMSSSVLKPDMIQQLEPQSFYLIVSAAVAATLIWKLLTWYLGLPSSGSHALIGGLVGAGIVGIGPQAILIEKIGWKVLAPMLVAPLAAAVLGYLIFSTIKAVFRNAHRRIGEFFILFQRPVMVLLAASHGSNTSQKSMGLIAMILAAGMGATGSEMPLPTWVIYSCAAAIAIGVLTGGWRIVKTVGLRISKMEPVHAFSAQLASAVTMTCASILGGPVAVSQVVGPAVLGVGASRRASGVRWSSVEQIAYAWILTFPVSMIIGSGLCWCLKRFFT